MFDYDYVANWIVQFKDSIESEMNGRVKGSSAEVRDDMWTIRKCLARTLYECVQIGDTQPAEYVALVMANAVNRVVNDGDTRDLAYAVAELTDIVYCGLVETPRGV